MSLNRTGGRDVSVQNNLEVDICLCIELEVDMSLNKTGDRDVSLQNWRQRGRIQFSYFNLKNEAV